VPPFIDLVAVKLISLIGTRTPACSPCTYTLREAGNGVVVKADPTDSRPLPVADPLPFIWLLIRRSFLQDAVSYQPSALKYRFRKLIVEGCVLIAISQTKKPHR
jgi:hypothetical protein